MAHPGSRRLPTSERSRRRAGAGRGSAALLGAALLCVATVAAWLAAPPASAAEPINLSRSAGASTNPAIAAADDRVMVVWEEGDALWYALRTAAAWTTAAPVPAAVGVTPALAGAPDGSFELVWSQFSEIDGNDEILHSRFAAGLWSLPDPVATTAGSSVDPVIAVAADGTRLVVWVEVDPGSEALYAASAPAGIPWAYGPLPDAAGTAPDLAHAGGAWHLAWVTDLDGDGAGDLLYRQRATGGWSAPEVVFMGDAAAADPSLAATASGEVALAWLSGAATVSFAQRVNEAWSDAVAVDGGEGATGRPALALAGTGPVVAWPRGADVRLARATGGTWSSPTTAMQFTARARGAALAVTATGLGLVAEGRAAGEAGDIFFSEPGAPPATAIPSTATPTVPVTATSPAVDTPTPTVTRGATATPSPPSPTPSMATPPTVPPTATAGPRVRIYLPWAGKAARRR